jgi:hypothetical protein
MKSYIEMTAEGLRMLAFLTLVGIGTLFLAPLTGCDKKPVKPIPDPQVEKDISINAPGVNIEVDRTRNADGTRDVDVNVNPGGGPAVDVDVDRTPGDRPAVDVDVDNK